MKKTIFSLLIMCALLIPASAIGEEVHTMGNSGSNSSEDRTVMTIRVKANGNTIVFELNTSPAAKDLYAQLPLSITVEDYGSNEKIFYPPEKLNTTDTPLMDGAQVGTLAYYAPWGDVVLFYGGFSSAPRLYELGHVISGEEYIQGMSGEIRIEKGSSP
jgi:hypothetical protein